VNDRRALRTRLFDPIGFQTTGNFRIVSIASELLARIESSSVLDQRNAGRIREIRPQRLFKAKKTGAGGNPLELDRLASRTRWCTGHKSRAIVVSVHRESLGGLAIVASLRETFKAT